MTRQGPPRSRHGHVRDPEPLAASAWQIARFLDREKRFTVHAQLPDGSIIAAHTNNTGRMTGCAEPGARCWLSPAATRTRKLAWTLEVIEARTAAAPGPTSVPTSEPTPDQAPDQAPEPESEPPPEPRQEPLKDPDLATPPIPFDAPAPAPGRVLVGVNTARPVALVAQAVTMGLWPSLAGCRVVRREVDFPVDLARGSRADLLLADERGRRVWVEVKNVTWVVGGRALFPDAPTKRGRKHLRDLVACVRAGERAALVFCVQRADGTSVAPASAVDPAYAAALSAARAAGVEALALRAAVFPAGSVPAAALPVVQDIPR